VQCDVSCLVQRLMNVYILYESNVKLVDLCVKISPIPARRDAYSGRRPAACPRAAAAAHAGAAPPRIDALRGSENIFLRPPYHRRCGIRPSFHDPGRNRHFFCTGSCVRYYPVQVPNTAHRRNINNNSKTVLCVKK
jgi:hypothetical protein